MQEDHFPFVYCVERLVYERKYPEWESCFEDLGLDPKAVSECYTGGYDDEVSLLLDLLCFCSRLIQVVGGDFLKPCSLWTNKWSFQEQISKCGDYS
jgi:hypothetical protein